MFSASLALMKPGAIVLVTLITLQLAEGSRIAEFW
jgi:hypothetical protein